MRIELSSQGVTGVGFLNIVFVDPEEYPPLVIDWTPYDTYIPSRPGTITLLTEGRDKNPIAVEHTHPA